MRNVDVSLPLVAASGSCWKTAHSALCHCMRPSPAHRSHTATRSQPWQRSAAGRARVTSTSLAPASSAALSNVTAATWPPPMGVPRTATNRSPTRTMPRLADVVVMRVTTATGCSAPFGIMSSSTTPNEPSLVFSDTTCSEVMSLSGSWSKQKLHTICAAGSKMTESAGGAAATTSPLAMASLAKTPMPRFWPVERRSARPPGSRPRSHRPLGVPSVGDASSAVSSPAAVVPFAAIFLAFFASRFLRLASALSAASSATASPVTDGLCSTPSSEMSTAASWTSTSFIVFWQSSCPMSVPLPSNS